MNASSHIIVFGNEKGGTGKSTLLMHVVVALLQQDKRVGIIDLDSRQRTIGRYIENRQALARKNNLSLTMPGYRVVPPSTLDSHEQRRGQERQHLEETIGELSSEADFIVIDCPGNDTYRATLAHAHADTLVTPLNDSFIDLDLIGEVDGNDFSVQRLSHYSEMVWESRKLRALMQRPPIDWIVTRNRLSTLDSKNNQRVHKAISALQKKIMFRYIPGLNERVIYRELFPLGLTLLDLQRVKETGRTQLSHIAARSELRRLMDELRLPGLGAKEDAPRKAIADAAG